MSQSDDWNPSGVNPLVSKADIPRVVAKSVNSVSAFGAKNSVHFLSPPFPTEPTSLGFGGDPQLGNLWGALFGSPERGAVSGLSR